MLEIGWPPQISNMLTLIELLRHHDGAKFEKNPKTRKFPIFLAFPRDKMSTQSKQQPRTGCCLRKTCREAT